MPRVKIAPTFPVQVPKAVGLQPVRQTAKQQMTSKVSGRWPAECGMPMTAKLTNVEITQARNLGVEFLAVRQRRTRRLRTTPARKPRTECCCQPVAFIIASIVAPVGDCSNAMTRDCFEPRSALFGSGSPAPCRDDFVVGTAAGADAIGRFFADFDI